MAKRKKKPDIDWSSIALWGPTGAGKDWLVQAFIQELKRLNQSGGRFRYELYEIRPGHKQGKEQLLFADCPDDIPGTLSFEDKRYRFLRKDSEGNKTQNQVHEFIIHNDAGGKLEKCLFDPDIYSSTYETLMKSQNLILVLSLGERPLSDAVAQKENLEAGQAAETTAKVNKNYVIEKLFKALSDVPNRNIAICLTKADLEVVNGDDPDEIFMSDPWAVMDERYDEDLRKILEKQQKRFNIRCFVTTSIGFFNENGKAVKNINIKENKLKDINRWRPRNTVAPFFWIFEQIEQHRYSALSFKFLFSNGMDKLEPYPYNKPIN